MQYHTKLSYLAPLCERLLGATGGVRHRDKNNMREDIRHSVERLLNTRNRFISADRSAQHVAKSIVEYGITDSAFINLYTPRGQDDFARQIEQCIGCFEPRLRRVRVTFAGTNELTFIFKIEAMLNNSDHSDHITFKSCHDPRRKSVLVMGEN